MYGDPFRSPGNSVSGENVWGPGSSMQNWAGAMSLVRVRLSAARKEMFVFFAAM